MFPYSVVWDEIKSGVIINCFQKATFSVLNSEEENFHSATAIFLRLFDSG